MFIKIRTDMGIILLPISTIFDIKSIEHHKKHFSNVRQYDEKYDYVIIRKDLPYGTNSQCFEVNRELLITEDTLSEIIRLFSFKNIYKSLLTDDKKEVYEENK